MSSTDSIGSQWKDLHGPSDYGQSYQIYKECLSCPFFRDLESAGEGFVTGVFDAASADIAIVLQSCAITFFLVSGLLVILGKIQAQEQVKKVVYFAATAIVAATFLNNADLYREWIWNPLENLALDYGQLVLKNSQSDGFNLELASAGVSLGSMTGYEKLIFYVEALVMGVIVFCWDMVAVWNPGRAIAALILLIPYLFVFGIFVAFMVEAIFKFIAIGLAAPVLIAGMPFPFTRAFGIAGLRIIIGAMFTIVFAAAAMGFSMGTVHKYEVPLRYALANTPEKIKQAEQDYADMVAYECGEDSQSMGCLNAKDAQSLAMNKASEGDITVFSKDFILLFIMGFVSILLHLQAKSLASNIYGANDGAGPAAATVAAGKMLMGAGMLAAGRTMFGQGGLGGTIAQHAHQNPGGFVQGGLVGGTAANLVAQFSGRGGSESSGISSGWGGAPQGASYSAGGGPSPKDWKRLTTSLGSITKGLEDLNKNLTTGRTRNG